MLSASEATPQRSGSKVALLVGCALIAILAWLCYRSVFSLGHLGWDTWPLIAASRITSVGDFFGTFNEVLMDGRYPLGTFYRPATHFSFALDYALWGTNPWGYHLTDFAILLASAFACCALAMGWFGRASAGLLSALLFVLHPVHWDVLPVSARRADTLSALLVLVTLVRCFHLQRDWAGGLGLAKWRWLEIALWSLLAVGAKETGALVGGLAPLLMLLGPGPRKNNTAESSESLSRVGLALRVAGCSVGAVLLFAAVRTAVIGGLGGHPESDLVGGLLNSPSLAGTYITSLFVPQPWTLEAGQSVRRAPMLGLFWLLAALPLWWKSHDPTKAGAAPELLSENAWSSRSVLLFLLLWFVATLMITGVSGANQPWYSLPFLPVFVLLLGGSFGLGFKHIERSSGNLRWLALPAMAAVALVSTGCLRFCGLFFEYPTWRQTNVAVNQLLKQVDTAVGDFQKADPIRRAKQGARRDLGGMPLLRAAAPGRVGVHSAAGIADYSVQAYVDLEHADHAVRVGDIRFLAQGSASLPVAGELLLRLIPEGVELRNRLSNP